MKTKINSSVEWNYHGDNITLTFTDYTGEKAVSYCRAYNTEKGANIAATKFHNKIARKLAIKNN